MIIDSITKYYYNHKINPTSATCLALNLPNGLASYDESPVTNGKYTVDTVVSFTCNYGYSLSGSTSRTCQTSGNWDEEMPTCNQSKKPIQCLLTR